MTPCGALAFPLPHMCITGSLSMTHVGLLLLLLPQARHDIMTGRERWLHILTCDVPPNAAQSCSYPGCMLAKFVVLHGAHCMVSRNVDVAAT